MKNKTAYMGLFLSFALILSYVESLIPFYFGVPGVKLGLANLERSAGLKSGEGFPVRFFIWESVYGDI